MKRRWRGKEGILKGNESQHLWDGLQYANLHTDQDMRVSADVSAKAL